MKRITSNSCFCLLLLLLAIMLSPKVYSQNGMIPQIGHQETIVHAEASPNGRWMATGGRDRVILLWDMQKGLHWTLSGHSFVISGIDFNDTGDLLATADARGKVFIWDVKTREIIHQKDVRQDVGDIEFIPGKTELTLGYGGKMRVWNYKTGQEKTTAAGVGESKSSVSITPDGRFRVLTSKSMNYIDGKFSTNYAFQVFDLNQNQVVSRADLLSNGKDWVANAIGDKGKNIALADGTQIVIQNFATGKFVKSFKISGTINKLYYNNDGSKVIASYEDGLIAICDMKTGKIKKVSGVTGSEIPAGLIAYDQVYETIVGIDNKFLTLTTYDITSDRTIGQFIPKSAVAWNMVWNEAENKLYVDNKDMTGDQSYEADKGRSTVVWDLNALNISSQSTAPFTSTTVDFDANFKRTLERKYNIVKNTDHKGIKILDNENDAVVKSLNTDQPITGAQLSQFNSKLFVSTVDAITVYEFPSMKLIKEFPYEEGAPFGIELSPDGQLMAVGKTAETVMYGDSEKPLEFNIDLYDIKTVSLAKQLKGHYSTITALEFTPDGKLFSGAYDGTIRLWDVSSGEQLALLHGSSPEYYFILANNGYYTLSKNAIDKVAYSSTTTIYPAAQFEIKYNRPDKVAESVGYSSPALKQAYTKAYKKRIQKLGITEEALDLNNLPEVRLTSNYPQSTADKEIKLDIEASDSQVNLAYLRVEINNVPIFGQEGVSVKNVKEINKNFTIELSAGKNHISVTAVNEQGLSSAPATFDITCTQKVKPDLYLFTVGVSKFSDAQYNLTYASKDANDLTDFFETRKNDYGKIVVKNFNDYDATRDNIMTATDFFAPAKVDDEVIIFTASHGLLDDELDYYVATTNMIFTQPSVNGLKYEELERMFTNTKARNRLLMIDACHSGEVDKDEVTVEANTKAKSLGNNVKSRGFKNVKSKSTELGLKNSFDMMKELFADMRSGTGATVISSAGGTEFALESDQWKNGVFTYAVLNGLKSEIADANKDDNISVTELKTYVFDEVDKLTNGKQHPTSRIENLKNDFTVASTANAATERYNPIGIWALSYSYYGDSRKRYFEIFKNGINLDVYSEGMEDYSKKWKRGSNAMQFEKVSANKYQDKSGAIIELTTDNQMNYSYGYGDNAYVRTNEIIRPQQKNTTSSSTQKTYNAMKTVPKTSVAKTYSHTLSGTWTRSDGKKDANGKAYQVTISGSASGGVIVKFNNTGKTFTYDKTNDKLYEYKLGSLTFKVEQNKNGTLNINNQVFKK